MNRFVDRDPRTAVRPERAHRRSCVSMVMLALTAVFGCDRAPPLESSRDDLIGRVDSMALVFTPGPLFGSDRSIFIDRFEVTNAEFARFLRETGYRPADGSGFLLHWGGSTAAPADTRLLSHPVVFVSRADAEAFAVWRGAALPTVDEWERAAREVIGGQSESLGRFYMNARETGIGGTARVGTFESGRTRSPIVAPPVYDLLGNVREWTSTDSPADEHAITKGGSFADPVRNIRPDVSHLEEPDNRNHALGFRCVLRDASGFLRSVLERLPTLEPAEREREESRLAEFDAPLARLLKRMHLKEVLAACVSTDEGESDLCVPLSDGRVVRMTANGEARLLDGETPVSFIAGLGECYHARAADLDGDGVDEVYAASNIVEGSIDERMIELGSDGAATMLEIATGAPLAWARAQGSLAADFRDAFPTQSTQPTAEPNWWHVPRFLQKLRRIDVTQGTLVVRWAVDVPYSDVLVPVPATGEILVPSVLWAGRDAFEIDARRVLDPHVVHAASGAIARLGAIPGGCASIALLDQDPLRFVAVTDTGHVVIAERQPEGLIVSTRDRDPAHPDGILVVESESGGAVLSRAGAPGRLELVRFDESGRERVRRTLAGSSDRWLQLLPLGGPGLGGAVLVREGADRLLRLGDDLSDGWRCVGLEHLDIGAVAPVVMAPVAGAPPRVALPLDFDGFVVIDADRGRILERFADPGTGLVELISLRGERNELWVAYRDQGLFRIPFHRRSVVAEQAARLLDRIDPLGTRP